jgi:hypothetical protein
MALTINASFDPPVQSAPAGFTTAVMAAVRFIEHMFSNNVTLNISFGYGEVDGMPISSGNLSQSYFSHGIDYSYANLRNALANNARSATQLNAVSSLPATDPTGGGTFRLTPAEADALSNNGSIATGLYVGLSSTNSFSFDPTHRAVSGSMLSGS